MTTVATAEVAGLRPPGEVEELPPAAPPSRERRTWLWPIPVLAVGLAIAALAIYRSTRRGRPSIDPFHSAATDLAGLDPESPGAATRVADIVRRLLVQAFAVPADRVTTPELMASLPAPLALRRNALAAVLVACDAARFSADGRIAPAAIDETKSLVAVLVTRVDPARTQEKV